MFKVIRQCVRGCTDLPHVGPHPGAAVLVVVILLGGIAGLKGRLGFLAGAAIMSAVYVPIYLYGAYRRAQLSDRLAEK